MKNDACLQVVELTLVVAAAESNLQWVGATIPSKTSNIYPNTLFWGGPSGNIEQSISYISIPLFSVCGLALPVYCSQYVTEVHWNHRCLLPVWHALNWWFSFSILESQTLRALSLNFLKPVYCWQWQLWGYEVSQPTPSSCWAHLSIPYTASFGCARGEKKAQTESWKSQSSWVGLN